MTKPESEKLVTQVSERVRGALEEAERRAQEIVDEAEARAKEMLAEADRQAARLRSEAEQEARARIDRAREALTELETKLAGGQRAAPGSAAAAPEEAPAEAFPEPVAEAKPAEEEPAPAPEPVKDPESEPEPPHEEEPEPEPPPEREPEPEAPPFQPTVASPSTDELIDQLRGGGTAPGDGGDGGDAAGARLVAMNMALEGASREEIDRHLAQEFGIANRGDLIDEVLSRVGR